MSHLKEFYQLYFPQPKRNQLVCEATVIPVKEYPPASLIQQVAQTFTEKLSPSDLARFNGRLERGLQLALDQAVSPDVGSSNRYRVHSATGAGAYLVDLEHKTCECPDSLKGNICKHRIAAYYYAQTLKLREPQKEESPTKPLVQPAPNRDAQILKEIGYAPEKQEAAKEPVQSVHRLGCLYSRYLHGADLDGKAYQVTIREITQEKVTPHPSQPQEEKWCLWVSGLPEGLPTGILFGVRGEKDLLAVFGRVEVGTLKGKGLVIYPVTTTVAGQNTVSIRFRSKL